MLFILTFLVVAKLCNLLLVLKDEQSCFKKVVSSYSIQILLLIRTYSTLIVFYSYNKCISLSPLKIVI